jgi:hypothetical protein
VKKRRTSKGRVRKPKNGEISESHAAWIDDSGERIGFWLNGDFCDLRAAHRLAKWLTQFADWAEQKEKASQAKTT